MSALTQPHQTRKKKHVHQQRKPPFPVPISGLTGEPCRANHWYYYTGRILGGFVIVDHTGDISYLNDMGFFGHGLLSRGAPELYESLPFVMLPGKTESMPQRTRVMRKRMYLRHMRWKKCQEETSRDPDPDNNQLSDLDEEFDSDLEYYPLPHNEHAIEQKIDDREMLASDGEMHEPKTDRRSNPDTANCLSNMDENIQTRITSSISSSTDLWSSNFKDRNKVKDWSDNQNEDTDSWTTTNQSKESYLWNSDSANQCKDADLWNSNSANQNTVVESWDTMEADEEFWTSETPAIVNEGKNKVLDHYVSVAVSDEDNKDELSYRTETKNHQKTFDAIDTHKKKRDYEDVDFAGDNCKTNINEKKIKLQHEGTNISDGTETESVSKTVFIESADECNDTFEKVISSENHQSETDKSNDKTEDSSHIESGKDIFENIGKRNIDKADDTIDALNAESDMTEVTDVPKAETEMTDIKLELPLHPYCIEEIETYIGADVGKAFGKNNYKENVCDKSDDRPYWDNIENDRTYEDSQIRKSDDNIHVKGIVKEHDSKVEINKKIKHDKIDNKEQKQKENYDKDKFNICNKTGDVEPSNKDHRDKVHNMSGNDEDLDVEGEASNKDHRDKAHEDSDVEGEPTNKDHMDKVHNKSDNNQDSDVESKPNNKVDADRGFDNNGNDNKDSNDEGDDYLMIDDSDIDDGMVFIEKKEKFRWKTVKKRDPYRLNEPLILALEEAFFLSYGLGCLFIQDMEGAGNHGNGAGNHGNLSLREMWSRYNGYKHRFLPLYAAYHFFRSKGWVPKPGIVFGVDFILYKVGPPFYHATYSIIVKTVLEGSLEEVEEYKGTCQTWETFSGVYRTTEHVAKTLMFCYVILPKDWDKVDKSSPDCLTTIKIRTQYVNRWVSSQERGVKTAGDDVL